LTSEIASLPKMYFQKMWRLLILNDFMEICSCLAVLLLTMALYLFLTIIIVVSFYP